MVTSCDRFESIATLYKTGPRFVAVTTIMKGYDSFYEEMIPQDLGIHQKKEKELSKPIIIVPVLIYILYF